MRRLPWSALLLTTALLLGTGGPLATPAGAAAPKIPMSASGGLSPGVKVKKNTTCSLSVRAHGKRVDFPALRAPSSGLMRFSWTAPADAPSGVWRFTMHCTMRGVHTVATRSARVTRKAGGKGALALPGSFVGAGGTAGTGKGQACARDQRGHKVCFAGDPYNATNGGADVGSAAWFAVGRRPDLATIVSGSPKQWLGQVSGRRTVLTAPAPGTIAVSTAGAGYAAYVVSVHGNNVIVNDANFRNDDIVRYSHAVPARMFQGYIGGAPAPAAPTPTPAPIATPEALVPAGHAPTSTNTHHGVVTIRSSDGRVAAFSIGDDGNLYFAAQTSPGGSWTKLMSLGGDLRPNGSPAVAADPNGLEVFGIGNDGSMRRWSQVGNGPWSAVQSISAAGLFPAGAIPWAIENTDGRMEVFAIETDGQMHHAWQATPGSAFGAFALIAGSLYPDGASFVAREANNHLDAFAVGTDGAVQHSVQGDDGGWAAFADVTGGGLFPDHSNVTVAADSDGRLELFGGGFQQQLWHAWENSLGGNWSAATAFPGVPIHANGAPAVVLNSAGYLEVFVIGADGTLLHSVGQDYGVWSAWAPLSPAGVFADGTIPSVVTNSDGRLEVLARDDNGNLDHTSQTARGVNSWTPLTVISGGLGAH